MLSISFEKKNTLHRPIDSKVLNTRNFFTKTMTGGLPIGHNQCKGARTNESRTQLLTHMLYASLLR